MPIKFVGKDEIQKKRDLTNFYPKEFSNRGQIKKFINYISNNVFEKSNEHDIAGYIGNRVEGDSTDAIYVAEPTKTRQISQLIPVIKTNFNDYEENDTLYNFLSSMEGNGSIIYDQNKLLSYQYMSWCPAINVDMFLNYINYYWIPQLPTPVDNGSINTVYLPMIRLKGLSEISVSEILGKEKYTFEDITVKKYQLDEENEVYNWVEYANQSLTLKNGLIVLFEDLSESEYNNKIFMINGCGTGISFEEIIDSGDTPNYYTIEKGSIDDNVWSHTNMWVHKEILEIIDIDYLQRLKDYKAQRPILCYNKDIELYNHGTFGRGIADIATSMSKIQINGKKIDSINNVTITNGTRILLTSTKANEVALYKVTLTPLGYIQLNPILNGQQEEHLDYTTINDVVLVKSYQSDSSTLHPTALMFDGESWVSCQDKTEALQQPLFNLYDANGDSLALFENSEFIGSTLFDYKTTDDTEVKKDGILNRRLVVDNFGNYQFDNKIYTEEWYYTPYKENRTLIKGYKFYKDIKEDKLLNDWHLTKKSNIQYIKTQFNVKSSEDLSDGNFVMELKYTPDTNDNKKSVIVYNNGSVMNDGYTVEDNKITVESANVGDVFDIQFYKKDINDYLEDGYEYDCPLSLKLNQTNENIETIGYNNCLDHMMSIIDNQKDITGVSYGYNNYYTIKHDITLGNKIVQHITPIIKSMILTNTEETDVMNSIRYARNQYREFKYKFVNLVNVLIKSNKCPYTVNDLKKNMDLLNEDLFNIIEKINLGKQGLLPFYNNGCTSSFNYIPSTPAYLGLGVVYEPKIEQFKDGTTSDVVNVVVCHDGSIFKCTNTQLDYFVLKIESMIYDSITQFRDKLPSFKKLSIIPGRFRETEYTNEEYRRISNQFIEKYIVENKINIEENPQFDYSPDNEYAWKTWNYTGMVLENGEDAHGSYRSIFMYYYDTYRPDTHPWEMLGFGEIPSWWEEKYGVYPYKSTNTMWSDIENGIIADGEDKGQYDYLKRKDLVSKYLPVDENGKLKSPHAIGLTSKPLLGTAVKSWQVGDKGSYEFSYMLSSEYRYDMEMAMFLMKPNLWVETNWDTINRTILFKNTDYYQIIDAETLSRPSLKDIQVHNEYIDDAYIRKYGFQQWISDYLASNSRSIETYVGNRFRNADVVLGYRCGGYYQEGTVNLDTDTYGEIPSDNFRLNVYKSNADKIYTYSGMIVEKTSNGFVLDGYDETNPTFRIKIPDYYNKRTNFDIGRYSYTYYNVWKEQYKTVPYRTVYKNIQDLYTDIVGYGKALEDDGWAFIGLSASGEYLDFDKSGQTFLQWATNTSYASNDGNVILLNPGIAGIRLYHSGMIDNLSKTINGCASILNIHNQPVDKENMDIFRQSYVTEIKAKNENFALIKARVVEYENLLLIDNKTIYGDVLYEPLFANIINRIKLYGVKVGNWNGTLYAPGYIIGMNGAIPNLDKKADDLNYIFDTGNVHIKGDNDKLSKYTVGYVEKKNDRELLQNDTSMFDFYKGYIREKGTKAILNKLNRSNIVSSDNTGISLYEKWAFKEGEYGYTSDNSTQEFIIDQTKTNQNPQVITFETAVSNYYDSSISYSYGDKVVYKNYEYKCIVTSSTIGDFDYTEWESINYIGNYVVFWDDENWIKKQTNIVDNHFNFSDNIKTLPTGGCPMVSDVDYIVGTQEEADELLESMEIGQTIWVAKKNNDDWDVLKKEGVNKFISMRYKNVEELYNQAVCDNVYEINDNKEQKYINVSKEDIDANPLEYATTPVYSDIDLKNKICEYKDLQSPTYANEIGDYINGSKYKLKLLNTIFTTSLANGTIHNDAIVTCSDGQEYTYSNLNMQFSDTNNQIKKYYCKVTFIINTHVKTCYVTINGTTYARQSTDIVTEIVDDKPVIKTQAVFTINALEGDVLNYTISGNGCESITGVVNVGHQNITIEDELYYKEGATLINTSLDLISFDPEFVYPGIYEIEIMTAGGGAGSNTKLKKKSESWRHSHKMKTFYGQGGGAGSYFKARFEVSNDEAKTTALKVEDSDTLYSLTFGGSCGIGGAYKEYGGNDGSTPLSTFLNMIKNNTETKLLAMQSGVGGKGRGNGNEDESMFKISELDLAVVDGVIQNTSEFRTKGDGGKVFKSNIFANAITDEIELINGGSAELYKELGAKQIFTNTTRYGDGGDSQNSSGTAVSNGGNGSIVLKFIEDYAEHDADVEPIYEDTDDYIILGTDSLEYSTVYNKFINGKKPFYCYDASSVTAYRPNANIINSSTVFYRYRCKALTGKFNTDVILSLFKKTRNYVLDDIMTYYHTNEEAYKTYKCKVESIKGELITEENISTYFDEYDATVYYKIDTSDYFKWEIKTDDFVDVSSESSYSTLLPSTTYPVNTIVFWNGEEGGVKYQNFYKVGSSSYTTGTTITVDILKQAVADGKLLLINAYRNWASNAEYAQFSLIKNGTKYYKTLSYIKTETKSFEEFEKELKEVYTVIYTIKRAPIPYMVNGVINTQDPDTTYYIADGTTDEDDIVNNNDIVYEYNDLTHPDEMKVIRDTTYDNNTITYKMNENYEETPSSIKDNYLLYYDSDCTKPIVQELNRTQLTYGDMQSSKVEGDSYILIDKIGTYTSLMPQYINEPYWGNISIYGTYPITSGNITYYTRKSKENITDTDELYPNYNCNEDEIIYQYGSDDIDEWTAKGEAYYSVGDRVRYQNSGCYIRAQENTTDKTTSFYKPYWLQFTPNGSIIIDTVILKFSETKTYGKGDIIENSESDNDLYKYCICIKDRLEPGAYSSADWKKVSVIVDNRELLYSDLTKTVTDNIETSYKYLDGDIILWADNERIKEDNLTDAKMYYDEGLTDYAGTYGDFCPTWTSYDYTSNMYYNSYNVTDEKTYIKSGTTYTETSLYYKDENNGYLLFTPMKPNVSYNTDGYGKLYYEDDDENHESDNTHYYITLYKIVDDSFVQLTNSEVYTKAQERIAQYYAKSDITNEKLSSVITLSNYNSKSSEIIDLYYNKQAMGNHIKISNIITKLDEEASLAFIFGNKESDYVCSKFFDSEYGLYNIALSESSSADTTINEIVTDALANDEFISKDELHSLWYEYRMFIEKSGTNPFKKNAISHICECYNYHTCENHNEVYYKLYKLGSEFFCCKQLVLTRNINGEDNGDLVINYAKLFGKESDMLTFNRRKYYAWTNTSNDVTTAVYTLKNPNTTEILANDAIYTYDLTTDEYILIDNSKRKINSADNTNKIIVVETIISSEKSTYTLYTFDEEYNPISENKIVNTIMYKELGDLFYIFSDSYCYRNTTYSNAISDTDNIGGAEDAMSEEKYKVWMKAEYVNNDYKFDLRSMQTKRIAIQDIKSAFIIDNDTDLTLAKVSTFDPIQMIVPNNVLDEISYISTVDPVLDYNDLGNMWSEPRVGELWWDISKVRYVDYYQGDNEYRKTYWGKQLPGSEIVINEWTKSYEEPTDIKYVRKDEYNSKTDTIETTYYYWSKNPSEIPNNNIRTKSALSISKVINNPTDENIVWVAPIKCNMKGDRKNSFILANVRNVMNGQEVVLQMNMDSDNEVQDHAEWVLVNENKDSDIPSFLWEKMKDSLLEYKETDDGTLIVPDPSLTGNNRYGISFRPRQTMFKNNYEARRNFIACVNDIFASRNDKSASLDIESDLVNVIDEKPSSEYYVDTATTYLELKNWNESEYVGKNVLVEEDENHNNRWAIYHLNSLTEFTIVDYQKYNIQDFINYNDWYKNDAIRYQTPVTTIYSLKELNDTICSDGDIVKVVENNIWKLYQNQDGTFVKVGQEKMLLEIDNSIYNWFDEDVDNEESYIDYSKAKSLTTNTTYNVYDVIKVDDQYYQCIEEEITGESLPNEWETNAQYELNEKVLYNGIIYQCMVDKSTKGKFVASEWKTKWSEVFNLTEYEYKYNEMNILMKNIFEYFEE